MESAKISEVNSRIYPGDFPGVGGLTYGLLKSGLNVVAGIDIDDSCRYPYEQSNKGAIFVRADIAEMPVEDIASYYNENDVKV